MNVKVVEEPVTSLGEYACVSIGFTVDRVFDILEDELGHFVLTERVLERSYTKDYDAIDSGGPVKWAEQFDLTNWVLFGAFVNGRRVGGAALAVNTAGLTMLEDRSDLAVLWDVRVSSDVRGQGVGSALFRTAEQCAIAKGCRELKVETQDVNVPACRFYARHGCVLRAIDRFAYPELPNEVQLLWYKDLSGAGTG